MISIERSETAQRSALKIRGKFSLRQNSVFRLNLSWTEFCLGLNLAWTEFVSDYIPQLYSTCNLLIDKLLNQIMFDTSYMKRASELFTKLMTSVYTVFIHKVVSIQMYRCHYLLITTVGILMFLAFSEPEPGPERE